MELPVIGKVSVFVIDGDDRLLVFDHPEAPEAGIQVPAGTIERDEPPLTAALRELGEETGKASFEITRFLARKEIHEVRLGRLECHDRWFYQAVPTQPLPEEWLHGEAAPEGWIPFHFFWMTRSQAELALVPDHVEVYRLTAVELDRI